MNLWTAGWFTLGATALAWEILAIRSGHPNATLSSLLKRALGVRPSHWWRWLAVPAFLSALALAGVHIVTRWV